MLTRGRSGQPRPWQLGCGVAALAFLGFLGSVGCSGGSSGPLCGNGVRDDLEACDGTEFGAAACPDGTAGQLLCTAECALDTSACIALETCGNGVVDEDEPCDGLDSGGSTCTTEGFDSGPLACTTSCTLDTTGCCNDACPIAAARCQNDAVETCTEGGNGCRAFSVAPGDDCLASGGVCDDSGGTPACVSVCTDVCVQDGQTRCTGEVIETCGPTLAGCLDWAAGADCAALGGTCDDSGAVAACVPNCTDSCSPAAATACDADQVHTCLVQPDGCLAFELTEDCALAGEVCTEAGGAASCEAQCTDACTADELRCLGTVIQTCVVLGNGCLGFTATTQCSLTGETCDDSGGTPVCACEDNCLSDGDLRCNGEVLESCGPQPNGCRQYAPSDDCGARGEVCYAELPVPACQPNLGESCANPFPLALGDNTVTWTASSIDHLISLPSCVASGAMLGPDVVMSYDVISDGYLTVRVPKPVNNRWVLAVVDSACDLGNELGCASAYNEPQLETTLSVVAGQSLRFIARDHITGSAVLPQPLEVELEFNPCSPTPLCPADGDTRCQGEVVQTCAQTPAGCLDWGDTLDCTTLPATPVCDPRTDPVSCAVCTDVCPAVGTTRCNDDLIETCELGPQGCLTWSPSLDCVALEAICVIGGGGAICALPSGEDCQSMPRLVPGLNTVDWDATQQDHLLTSPTCASGAALSGPDVLLRYVATRDGFTEIALAKPNNQRAVFVVSAQPCGTVNPSVLCASTATGAFVEGVFPTVQGQTYIVYASDTSSGVAPLPDPLQIVVTELECFASCPFAGATRCAGTLLQTCTDTGTCLEWQSSEDCSVTAALCDAVTDPARCRLCQDGCPAEGATRCSAELLQTCATNANGCRAWTTTSDCAASGASCEATLSPAACLPAAVVGGDTCADRITVSDGPNFLNWSASTANYITSNPSCLTTGATTGPDLVLEYTATRTGVLKYAFEKTAGQRWVVEAYSDACGTRTNRLSCVSDQSLSTLAGEFPITLGQTYVFYLIDTTVGANPLNDPLALTLTPVACPNIPACQIGVAQCQGTTVRACLPDTNGCGAFVDEIDCALSGRFCSTSFGGATCLCSDGCPQLGQSRCTGDLVETCEPDGFGCQDWVAGDDCAATAELCDVSTGTAQCVTCIDQCPSLGASSCQGDVLRECQTTPSGCLDWQQVQDCSAGGERCLAQPTAACAPFVAEDCGTAYPLVEGLNVIDWDATETDYYDETFATLPSCLTAGIGPTGPDLVLQYTATLNGFIKIDLEKPANQRWVVVVSDAACGGIGDETLCISDLAPTHMLGELSVTQGTTYTFYVSDTISGSAPLSDPLRLTLFERTCQDTCTQEDVGTCAAPSTLTGCVRGADECLSPQTIDCALSGDLCVASLSDDGLRDLAVCAPAQGESCAAPIVLSEGVNTVDWAAEDQDYLTTTPSCVVFGDVTGPDVVLQYTPTQSGVVSYRWDKPTNVEYVVSVSDAPCGTLQEISCGSTFAGAQISDTFVAALGQTYTFYVSDTDNTADALVRPLEITIEETPFTGEDCAGAAPLALGPNSIPYLATNRDYLATEPTCTAFGLLDGPDVVLTYTATADGLLSYAMSKPSFQTYVLAVSDQSCGTIDDASEISCASAWSSTQLTGSFDVVDGTTYTFYVSDTTDGSALLPNPLVLTLSLAQCVDACATLGQRRCGAGEVQTCGVTPLGCRDWLTTNDCPATGETCTVDLNGPECAAPVGEDCASAVVLAPGVNIVDWAAGAQDYLDADHRPSCQTTSALVGPDVVLAYSPSQDGVVSYRIAKSANQRQSVVVTDGPCGGLHEVSCNSEFTAAQLTGAFNAFASQTYHFYLIDTDSGSLALPRPVAVEISESSGCLSSCPLAGDVRCLSGHLDRCAQGLSGCLEWTPVEDCTSSGGTCGGGSFPACVTCFDDCPAEGFSRCSGAELQACEVDIQGCLAWTPIESCTSPGESCSDTGGVASCVCPGGGCLPPPLAPSVPKASSSAWGEPLDIVRAALAQVFGDAAPVGEDCARAVTLRDGANTVEWTAGGNEHLVAERFDVLRGETLGPDLVMRYTATAAATLRWSLDGPARAAAWVQVARECGAGEPARIVEGAAHSGEIRVAAGETIHWVLAASGEGASLPNPLEITLEECPEVDGP